MSEHPEHPQRPRIFVIVSDRRGFSLGCSFGHSRSGGPDRGLTLRRAGRGKNWQRWWLIQLTRVRVTRCCVRTRFSLRNSGVASPPLPTPSRSFFAAQSAPDLARRRCTTAYEWWIRTGCIPQRSNQPLSPWRVGVLLSTHRHPPRQTLLSPLFRRQRRRANYESRAHLS